MEAQDRDIRLYLEGYSDQPYEIIGEFLEAATATDDNRPELTKALSIARSHGAELLVAKLDRLSRKVSFIAALMDDRKLNLRVASMPHADKFQLHIYAALAEQEREFISLRTKAALKEAKARGVKLGGLRDKTKKRNAAVQPRPNQRYHKTSASIAPTAIPKTAVDPAGSGWCGKTQSAFLRLTRVAVTSLLGGLYGP